MSARNIDFAQSTLQLVNSSTYAVVYIFHPNVPFGLLVGKRFVFANEIAANVGSGCVITRASRRFGRAACLRISGPTEEICRRAMELLECRQRTIRSRRPTAGSENHEEREQDAHQAPTHESHETRVEDPHEEHETHLQDLHEEQEKNQFIFIDYGFLSQSQPVDIKSISRQLAKSEYTLRIFCGISDYAVSLDDENEDEFEITCVPSVNLYDIFNDTVELSYRTGLIERRSFALAGDNERILPLVPQYRRYGCEIQVAQVHIDGTLRVNGIESTSTIVANTSFPENSSGFLHGVRTQSNGTIEPFISNVETTSALLTGARITQPASQDETLRARGIERSSTTVGSQDTGNNNIYSMIDSQRNPRVATQSLHNPFFGIPLHGHIMYDMSRYDAMALQWLVNPVSDHQMDQIDGYLSPFRGAYRTQPLSRHTSALPTNSANQLDTNRADDEADDFEIEELCVICMSRRRERVLLPCKHLCLCHGCCSLIDGKCPICRQPVRATVQMNAAAAQGYIRC